MKYFNLIFTILFLSKSAFGQQQTVFNKATSDPVSIALGEKAMSLIEANKPIELLKLYYDFKSVNKDELIRNLDDVSRICSYDKKMPLEIFIIDEKDRNQQYYVRNYCNRTSNSSMKCILQVRIDLVKNVNGYYIGDILFRRGNQIEEPLDEINSILEAEKNGRPAPPPLR